jgi:hypothetical protein
MVLDSKQAAKLKKTDIIRVLVLLFALKLKNSIDNKKIRDCRLFKHRILLLGDHMKAADSTLNMNTSQTSQRREVALPSATVKLKSNLKA